MRLRRATEDDLTDLEALDRECFPGETPHRWDLDTVVYVVTDDPTFAGVQIPVAYGCAVDSACKPGWVYLSRAGVSEPYRGHGLQKRLIRARVRWAAGRPVYTYTRDNPASGNALIACGFRLFDSGLTVNVPDERWWIRRGKVAC